MEERQKVGRRKADFSGRVRQTIIYKSNHTCSNPNCRKKTEQIGMGGLVYSIGEACHIEAASAGGARYNEKSTMEYRKSVENAIWLCSNCAEMIDKDWESYSVETLKKWKRDSERNGLGTDIRIFAVANEAGGVGKSSVTAYLAQAVASITEEPVLCVSVNAYNDAWKKLCQEKDYFAGEPGTKLITLTKNLDYLSDEAIEDEYNMQMMRKGRFSFQDITKEKNYQYVFIDCGNRAKEVKMPLFYMATDVIIPIGEHAHTMLGINTVGKWLKNTETLKRVWPIYSCGLRMSNKEYSRKWFQRVSDAINSIDVQENIELKQSGVIIPKSSYVGTSVLDIYHDRRTKSVAKAYLDVANEILRG